MRMMETLWQPIDFVDWVHRLRNCDIEDSVKELRDFNCDWEPYDETEVFEDSLNGSRISINMTPVKKRLNESVHYFSMDASMLEVTLNDRTSMTSHNQQEDVNACLTQIEIAAKTLNKLCQRYGNHDTKPIVESLTKMQDIVETLKNLFQSKDFNESEDASSINSADNTVIEMSNDVRNVLRKKGPSECKEGSTNIVNNVGKSEIDDKSNIEDDSEDHSSRMQSSSLTKSSLRSNVVLDAKTAGSPQKNVRFVDKTSRR